MSAERLTQQLRELGRAIEVPPIDTEALTERTMVRLAESPGNAGATRPNLLRRRWRALAGAAAALLLVFALTPPVRAAVADWFGVVVRSGPPAESQSAPAAESALTLDEARELVDFEPVEPGSLGTPDGVEVSPDGMVLSMTWSSPASAVTRVDQFAGVVPTFLKESLLVAEQIDLNGTPALWFDGPHHVVRIDESGREQVETARSAGPTLIVPVGELTVRIEGLDRAAALEVARSISGTD